MIEVMLTLILVALAALGVLIWKTRQVDVREIESALSRTWIALGLGERIVAIEEQARRIAESYRSFELLLRTPTERGSLGETSLETMLSDQLPPDMYAIRQRTFDGKIPDATIRSSAGIICIDCKFPLDNYRRLAEALSHSEVDTAQVDRLKRQFLRNVDGHLTKIAQDYVQPEKGSAEFAFAYIPSEAVYYFLVQEGYDLLRNHARRGVQVVSPLTLAHKLELIKAGVHARHLSENARAVQRDLQALARRFTAVDQAWRVLYDTHLRNLAAKAEEVDRAYRQLREEFARVAEVEEIGDGCHKS
ncbi:MAG: DNA recombination protein RmuC [Chloroflexi bacterium]|nr:DNA recombination protein RmuC [Chloroflexota bacterium]